MDTTSVKTIVGDLGEREFAVEEGGCLILTMIHGKPQTKLFSQEQWTALNEGIVSEAADYFESGSELQQEAYRLYHSLIPVPETENKRS